MSIDHLLAVVPVADLARAVDFYARLFDGEPDNTPMPSLSEWRVTDSGWVQVSVDAERAGTGLLNLAVADLDTTVDRLDAAGIAHESVVEADKGVRLCAVSDPDGNRLTFIGGFREVY